MSKLKILAAGCLHSDTKTIEKLAELAEKEDVDLVLLAGDITRFERQTEGIIGPFVKRNKTVFFVPGNHESFATADFLSKVYNAKNLHGAYYIFRDIGFFGVGGATQVGPNMITEEYALYLLTRAHRGVKTKNKKVLLTHEHPRGSFGDKVLPGSGSIAIRAAIEKFKPDLAICAHIHEASGIEERIGNTTLINVSRTAKIIEI